LIACSGASHAVALDLGTQAHLRAPDAQLPGIAGFTPSVIVSGPATLNCLIEPSDAGATPLKPAAKSFCAAAASYEPLTGRFGRSRARRKDTARPTWQIDEIVLF
jgi:hypothetical protein